MQQAGLYFPAMPQETAMRIEYKRVIGWGGQLGKPSNSADGIWKACLDPVRNAEQTRNLNLIRFGEEDLSALLELTRDEIDISAAREQEGHSPRERVVIQYTGFTLYGKPIRHYEVLGPEHTQRRICDARIERHVGDAIAYLREKGRGANWTPVAHPEN